MGKGLTLVHLWDEIILQDNSFCQKHEMNICQTALGSGKHTLQTDLFSPMNNQYIGQFVLSVPHWVLGDWKDIEFWYEKNFCQNKFVT